MNRIYSGFCSIKWGSAFLVVWFSALIGGLASGSCALQAPTGNPGDNKANKGGGLTTPAASGKEPIHVDPPSGERGQMLKLSLSGGDLATTLKDAKPNDSTSYRFYWVVAGKTDCSVSLPVTVISAENMNVGVPSDAMPGKYRLFNIVGATASTCGTDLGAEFLVGAAVGEYTTCPLDPFNSVSNDLLCSQALLTYKEEREVFGKSVADEYVAVEVKIQNRNSQFPFLLSDVRMGTDSALLTTSRDRTFVRTFADKGEMYSARAIALRAFQAASAILGGIGPAVGDTLLTSSIQIFQGPAGTALQGLFPDRSQQEMNFISDNGFSVAQAVVVPARSAVRVFCFMPQRMLLDERLRNFSDDRSCWPETLTPKSADQERPQKSSGHGGQQKGNDQGEHQKSDDQGTRGHKCWTASRFSASAPLSKFQWLQASLFVEIAGMHVTQVKTGPTLTQIFPDNVDAETTGGLRLNLSGSNFDQIRYIQIGDKSRFAIDPEPGNMNAAQATIDKVEDLITSAKGSSTEQQPLVLKVSLINTLGQSVDTSVQFTINAPKKTTPAPAPHNAGSAAPNQQTAQPLKTSAKPKPKTS